MPLEIKLAYHDIDKIKILFEEYTASLGIDLSFQNYDDEFLNLPADYALPLGRLYIANYSGQPAGCVALRPFRNRCCEMKRLYVRPAFRGNGIGKILVNQIIADARKMRYETMVLDCLTSLQNSIALYKKFGFQEIPPYRYNPLPNAIFLCLKL